MAKYRLDRLSANTIQIFSQCLLKYYYNYFAKEPAIMDTSIMRFGSAVHGALEYFGKQLKAGSQLNQLLIDETIDVFILKAADFRIEDQTSIDEGIAFIRNRLYRHNPTYKILEVELNFGSAKITTDKGTPLNGIIDLILEIEKNVILVVDYKTSRIAKSPAELREDTQLSVYDYAVSKLYPEATKIWLALDYLRSEPVITDRSPYERADFEKRVDATWKAMGNLKKDDLKPSLNTYCPWCGWKHLCHDYRKAVDSKVELVPASLLENEETFVEEWGKLKTLERILNNRKAELKSWVNRWVVENNESSLAGDSSVVNWTQSFRSSYKPDMILPHIPIEDLPNLIYFNKKALEAYVYNKHPELKALLDQSLDVNPSAPKLFMRDH